MNLAKLDEEALTFKNSGQHKEAIKLFEHILLADANWDHGNASHNLAQCYEEIGDFLNARRCYENALRCSPDYDVYVHNYAMFLSEHGSPEEALPYLFFAYGLALHTGIPTQLDQLRSLLQEIGASTGLSKEIIQEKIRTTERTAKN